MKFKLFAVLMATLLVACGGSHNSTGPSFVPSSAPNGTQSVPASSTFCFVDDLAQPLANATVGLASGEVIAVVADGCISLPADKSLAYAEAPGFRRLTDFPSIREDVALPQGTFALWPVSGYLEHLEEVDEWSEGSFGYPSFTGYRPKSGVYTVSLPGEMTNSASTTDMSAYRTALDGLLGDASAQASNKVLFSVSTGSSANIKIVVDPNGYRGYFEWILSGRYITGGTLKIKSLDVLINDPGTIRHELGHFLGVNHVIDNPNRLMYRGSSEYAYATEPEIVHFRMRFLRPAGFDARKG